MIDFVRAEVARLAASQGVAQTPGVFLPDDSPPRLSAQAKSAIRRLLGQSAVGRVDVKRAELQFSAAEQLAPGQPEPGLGFGLALLADKKTTYALEQFEEVRRVHPTNLLAIEAVAWIWFVKRDFPRGVGALEEYLRAIPKPSKMGGGYSEPPLEVFQWAGRLRQYAESMETKNSDRYQSLDAAVAARGPAASGKYEEGRSQVRAKAADYDKQIKDEFDANQKRLLGITKKQLTNYADFDLRAAAARVSRGLDQ